MPPSLDVSPEVLERLRALGREGIRSADQVLRLLLGLPEATPAGGASDAAPKSEQAFEDTTYGVRFPEGFEIFRTYKGRPYRARAEGGRWRLDADGRAYDSLNQLSQAVIDGNENAWMFWLFRGPDGRPRRIAELRDPAQVQRRPRRRRASIIATPARSLSIPAQPEPVASPTPVMSPAPMPTTTPAGMAWQPRPAPLTPTRPPRR
ncbi:MAG: hypothetical protein HYW28_08375 [Rhodospirillales bacterium]|nr:hypothetical protein [Rhodospirillales bacterium]